MDENMPWGSNGWKAREKEIEERYSTDEGSRFTDEVGDFKLTIGVEAANDDSHMIIGYVQVSAHVGFTKWPDWDFDDQEFYQALARFVERDLSSANVYEMLEPMEAEEWGLSVKVPDDKADEWVNRMHEAAFVPYMQKQFQDLIQKWEAEEEAAQKKEEKE